MRFSCHAARNAARDRSMPAERCCSFTTSPFIVSRLSCKVLTFLRYQTTPLTAQVLKHNKQDYYCTRAYSEYFAEQLSSA